MALKKYKPMTAGTRWRIGNAYAEITTNKPEKSLMEAQHSTAGRNVQGRRTSRYMGGGHKKHYRIIDFKRDKKDIASTGSLSQWQIQAFDNIQLNTGRHVIRIYFDKGGFNLKGIIFGR